MATVARTIITVVIAFVGDGYAAEMCADTDYNQPFAVWCALLISLGITELGNIDGTFMFDFRLGSVTNKNGLAYKNMNM